MIGSFCDVNKQTTINISLEILSVQEKVHSSCLGLIWQAVENPEHYEPLVSNIFDVSQDKDLQKFDHS